MSTPTGPSDDGPKKVPPNDDTKRVPPRPPPPQGPRPVGGAKPGVPGGTKMFVPRGASAPGATPKPAAAPQKTGEEEQVIKKPEQPASNPSLTPGRTGMTRRPQGKGTQVNVDRAALGLGSAAPSQMIEGLEEYAKKAEKLEAREEEKRKAGGKISSNVAMQVDDTGRRWALMVRLFLFGSLVVIVSLVAFLIYRANNQPKDPKVAGDETRGMIAEFEVRARSLFKEGESVTAESARDRIRQSIESDLKAKEDSISKDRARQRAITSAVQRDRDKLAIWKEMKDGWGYPLQFKMEDADTLVIFADANSPAVKQKLVEERRINIRAARQEQPEKP